MSFGFSGFGSNTANKPAFGASNTFGATNNFGNTTSNFGSTPNTFGSPTNATGFTGQSNFGNTNTSQGFGAANNQSNPFGAKPTSSGFGGNFGTPQQTGFGSTAAPTANTFGATNPIGSTPFGASNNAFGASNTPKPAFGNTFGSQAPAASNNTFGANTANPGFGFGNQAKPFGSSPGTGFGTTATTPAPAFGASTTPFGATPAFGAASTTPGFGAQNTPSAFGSANTQPSFGAQTANAFGAPTTNSFGSNLNQPTQGSFGSTTNNMFGQPAANPFGQTAFGAPSQPTSTFGNPQNNTFGSTSTPSTFGMSFGTQAPNTLSSPFGSNSIGSMPTNQPQSTSFGGFGGAATNPQQGGAFGAATAAKPMGTGTPTFRPVAIQDKKNNQTVTNFIQAITSMSEYSGKSFDELRLEDYVKNNKVPGNFAFNSAPQATTGFGSQQTTAFGSTNPPFGQSTANAFGNTQSSGSTFGTTSAFGSSTPAFGAPTTTAPAFGSTTTSTFGAPSTTTTFGAAPAFGTSTAPAFGNNTTPAFGTNSTPSFGASNPPQTSGFGSSFGSNQPSNLNGTNTTSSGFGAPGGFGTLGSSFSNPSATSTQSLSFGLGNNSASGFGAAKPATPAFGASTPTGFGSALTPGFGAPATNQANTFSFGSAQSPGLTAGQAPSQTSFGFGTSASPGLKLGSTTPTTTSFGTGLGFGSSLGQSSFGTTAPAFGTNNNSVTPGPSFSLGFGSTTPSNQAFGTPGFSQPAQQQIQATQVNLIPTVDQKIELLTKKSKELAEGNKPVDLDIEKRIATPSITGSGLGLSSISRSTLPTSAKILPRGLRSSSKPVLKTPLSQFKSTSSNVPDSQPNSMTSFSSSAKKLVISSLYTPGTTTDIDDLPPPPSTLAMSVTPQRITNFNTSTSHIEELGSLSTMKMITHGDATGLTPTIRATPRAITLTPGNGKSKIEDNNVSILKFLSPTPDIPTKPSSEVDFQSSLLENDFAPTLTKPDYVTTPNINILSNMSLTELSCVRGFSIFRQGVGKIEWQENVDLRGLDLDEVISIEHKEVFVYGETDSPPLGCGLNHPAIITFYNVFPKDKSSAEKIQKHESKLREFCNKNDAEFIRYDIENGEWIFAVKHFSKYALEDSDDEEEVSGLPQSASQPIDQPISSIDEVQPLPTVESLNNKRPLNESFGSIKKLKSILLKPQNVSPMPKFTPENIQKSAVVSSIGRPRLKFTDYETDDEMELPANETSIVPIEELKSNLLKNSNKFYLPSESPSTKLLLEVKKESRRKLGKSDIDELDYTKPVSSISNTSSNKKMLDHRLSMGRSFRVGWSNDGKIAVPLNSSNFTNTRLSGFENRVIIEQVNTSQWETSNWGHASTKESNMRFENSLQLILKASKASGDLYPFWELPLVSSSYNIYLELLKKLIGSLSSQYIPKDHPDWNLYRALGLIDAAAGQERIDDSNENYVPLYEERDGHPDDWERRRQMISIWFEQVVQDTTYVKTTNNQDDLVFIQVFEFLTLHRIEEAVNLLELSGNFRLATILSQIGSDRNSNVLVNSQLEKWKSMDALKTISNPVLQLYQLLTGHFVHDGKSLLQDLPWIRSIAMIYWYGIDSPDSSNTCSSAISQFRDLLANELVNQPQSTFSPENNPTIKHGLFPLLEILFLRNYDTKTSFETALMTQAFTLDGLNHQQTYTLLILLEGLGFLVPTDFISLITRQNLIFQLSSRGEWSLAVFIALQIPHPSSRQQIVSDLIYRWAGLENKSQNEKHLQLLTDLKISEELIHESTAYFLGSQHKIKEQIDSYILAKKWKEASFVTSLQLAPFIILSSKGDYDKLLEVLEKIHDELDKSSGRIENNSTKIGAIIKDYLTLYDASKAMLNEVNSMEDPDSVLFELSHKAQNLMENLTDLNKKFLDMKSKDPFFDDKLYCNMLLEMGSYIYNFLSTVQVKNSPKDSFMFRNEVLDSAPVAPSCIIEAVDQGLNRFIFESADCLA